MTAATRVRVRERAGDDDESNLCLACIDCNLHKGTNLTGIDPLTDEVTPLFHPRQQRWDEHFRWDEFCCRQQFRNERS